MSTATAPETDELQEQARAETQLAQAEQFTMEGHLRKKLALGRQRLAETWKLKPEAAEDDMQVLARDIDLSEKHFHPAPVVTNAPPTPPAPKKHGWLLPAALALGLGVPATTAIVMAPTIIRALRPVTTSPAIDKPAGPDYAPILLPGRPPGAPR